MALCQCKRKSKATADFEKLLVQRGLSVSESRGAIIAFNKFADTISDSVKKLVEEKGYSQKEAQSKVLDILRKQH
mgnify:FL=1